MKRCLSCFQEYDDSLTVCPHCGQPEDLEPVEPIHLVPGTILENRYLLGRAVGSGGFGVVYRAFDLKLDTIVAVKEFYVSRLVTRASGQKELIVSAKSQAEFLYRKERFLAEARDMAKFSDHRSIPSVFEFFEENNTAYIVMELLQGETLSAYLRQKEGKIDPDFALLIANEVGKALISLHEKKIIHRDVAPDNIFICAGKDLKIKLMDLGAAKLTDASENVVDIILKPGYSPTEQYDNKQKIGPWTDIYALGATLYRMLTGVKPVESTNRLIEDDLVPPKELNPDISENLNNTILKAMAIEKHMRFQNVKDFLAAINSERKVVSLDMEKKQRKLKRALSIVAAVAVVLAGALAGLYKLQQEMGEQILEPAEVSVWFSVAEDSTEEIAMQSIAADFEGVYEGVAIDLRAIPEDEYAREIQKAAKEGDLPNLFESTGLTDEILSDAQDLMPITKTEQFKNCYFLNQYSKVYPERKKLPLAIEVPMAFVITSGATDIEYKDQYFRSLDDFGINTRITCDVDDKWVRSLFPDYKFSSDLSEFFDNEENTSPVLLSTSMTTNKVRTGIIYYEKKYVYYDADKIPCRFIYEWSIGSGSEEQLAAAQRMLTWMLGNSYQTSLMITNCSDGQIPVNKTCFETKIDSRIWRPIREIYEKFVFE